MKGTVELEIALRQDATVNVHICDIMQAINDLPMAERWNTVAQLINQVELDCEDLAPEQQQVILEWLDARTKSFSKSRGVTIGTEEINL